MITNKEKNKVNILFFKMIYFDVIVEEKHVLLNQILQSVNTIFLKIKTLKL